MHRIDSLNARTDENGAGKNGFNDNTDIPQMDATYGTPEWFNAVQEEIANVVEADGTTALDKTQNNQLLGAITRLFNAAKSYAQGLDLARAIDVLNRFNNEAYIRDQADQNEATARSNGDNALQAKIGAVGAIDLQTQVNNINTAVEGIYPKAIATGLLFMTGSDNDVNTTWTGTVDKSLYGNADLTNTSKYLLQPSFLGGGHLPAAPGGFSAAWSTTRTADDFTCSMMIADNSPTQSAGVDQVAWVVWQITA